MNPFVIVGSASFADEVRERENVPDDTPAVRSASELAPGDAEGKYLIVPGSVDFDLAGIGRLASGLLVPLWAMVAVNSELLDFKLGGPTRPPLPAWRIVPVEDLGVRGAMIVTWSPQAALSVQRTLGKAWHKADWRVTATVAEMQSHVVATDQAIYVSDAACIPTIVSFRFAPAPGRSLEDMSPAEVSACFEGAVAYRVLRGTEDT